MKRIAIFAASLLLNAASASAENVTVGVIQALSGPAVIVDFGESYLQGIQLAVDEYKASKPKHNINLIVYNDEANPQRSLQLAQRLVTSDDASVVLGTVNSGSVAAFAPYLQQAKVPLVAGPAAATEITSNFNAQFPSYIFRCSMVEKHQVDVVLDYAVSKSKKIGILHSTGGYGLFASKALQEGLAARGLKAVEVQSSQVDANDLSPQILRLRDSRAEVLLQFHEGFEAVFRSLEKASYRPTVIGTWGLSSLTLLNTARKDVDGVLMAQALDMNTPSAQAFDAKMRAKNGDKYRWPVVAALGYDAARLVLQAVDVAGRNRAGIRDALEATNGFEAVTGTPAGPYSKGDHECLDRDDVFLGVWKDGKVVKLK